VGLYYEIVSKYTKIELTNSIESNANRLTNINKNLGLLLWALGSCFNKAWPNQPLRFVHSNLNLFIIVCLVTAG